MRVEQQGVLLVLMTEVMTCWCGYSGEHANADTFQARLEWLASVGQGSAEMDKIGPQYNSLLLGLGIKAVNFALHMEMATSSG